MQENRPLPHPRERHNRPMWFVIVAQFAVNLISDDDQVVLNADPGNPLKVLRADYSSGRIGGKVLHENP